MVAAAQQREGAAITIIMSKDEAARLVERINHHLQTGAHHFRKARELILTLKDGQGWRALGYSSWTACKKDALWLATAQIDREYKAAKMELQTGLEIGTVPERVWREVPGGWTPVADLLYQFAQQYAAAQGAKTPTRGVMRQVVEAVGDALITGAFLDDECETHPILGPLDLDIKTRLLELEKRRAQHKSGENRREYIMRDQCLTAASGLTVELPEQVLARIAGKLVYVSVWIDRE